jgi:DNA processing protein
MFHTQRIVRGEASYPALLNEIPQPPKVLYYRGDASLLSYPRLLSIVGSRKCSAYGTRVVHDAVFGCVGVGFVTVSGLAFGIDQAVHEETIAAGGRTIAVLGSPVEHTEIGPRSNMRLAEHIVESGGVLVSEYPSGTSVHAGFFPARNRIIAGLSHTTLVVEGWLKSGALITARFAADCGRDVFAVPGSIFSPVSEGTNRLLERGAIPWLSCASFLSDIEDGGAAAIATLGAETRIVLATCVNTPQTLEQIVSGSGLPPAKVMQCVTELMQKQLLRDLGDYTYVQSS